MPKGFVYILECADGTFYTGSTVDIEKRINEHNSGNGANHTKKRLPIKLVYIQEFQRIDDAFYKEKQIQGWSRKKKTALIEGNFNDLKKMSECKNETHYKEWFRLRSTTENRLRSATKKNQTFKPKGKMVAERSRSYSNGKLLLTGEYLVLDGALSLAIPTKYGQSLIVETIDEPKLIWESLDEKGNVWFEDEFLVDEITTSHTPRNDIRDRLFQILNAAKKLNPEFLNTTHGFKITTKLDFPKNWGLGTSSTLINNIAQWANVDAYKLLENTFGGSGYDIACAQHNKPITYKLLNDINEISRDTRNDKKRSVKEINFNPSFKKHLYFVYLNKKQNSRDGISDYKNNASDLSESISKINNITQNIISCNTLDDFILLIEKHENIISKIINLEPVKEHLFSNFNGAIKSLGAWGGDFILVASKNNPEDYFKNKGFETIIPYEDMVL